MQKFILPFAPCYTHLLRMPKTIPSLKRVNISIEGELHEMATRHAEKLGLTDGFSGYVSRLCKRELKRKDTKLANVSRLLHK